MKKINVWSYFKKEFVDEFVWGWHYCWALYLWPYTSIRDGYHNKPLNMTVLQHIAYPFKSLFVGFKAWGAIGDMHRQSKYSA